eukprot:scaffold4768_cov412-Prasinococcus_capsulatus_cf.AAC.22
MVSGIFGQGGSTRSGAQGHVCAPVHRGGGTLADRLVRPASFMCALPADCGRMSAAAARASPPAAAALQRGARSRWARERRGGAAGCARRMADRPPNRSRQQRIPRRRASPRRPVSRRVVHAPGAGPLPAPALPLHPPPSAAAATTRRRRHAREPA